MGYQIEESQDRKAPGRKRDMKGKRILGRRQRVICSKFYKKPMSSRLGILRRSAVTENTKVSTASSEFQRRWKNSSEHLPKEVMEEITAEYAGDLVGMGYTEEWVQRVLEGALLGYERLLARVSKGETSRHRLSHESDMVRRHKRLFLNNNWFKTKRREENQKEA